MGSKIKFGVVGQGHIGKRHAEMIRLNRQAELIAVCDIKTKEELNLQETNTHFYSSISEMLEKQTEIETLL